MKEQPLRMFSRALLKTYQVRSARSIDLSEALMRSVKEVWKHNETMCNEGDSSEKLYLLRRGTVRVLRKDYRGRSQELAQLTAPCVIGQMGLIDGSVRSATCVAHGTVEALCVDKETFNLLMDEDSAAASAFRQQMIAVMMSDLYGCNNKLSKLMEMQ